MGGNVKAGCQNIYHNARLHVEPFFFARTMYRPIQLNLASDNVGSLHLS